MIGGISMEVKMANNWYDYWSTKTENIQQPKSFGEGLVSELYKNIQDIIAKKKENEESVKKIRNEILLSGIKKNYDVDLSAPDFYKNMGIEENSRAGKLWKGIIGFTTKNKDNEISKKLKDYQDLLNIQKSAYEVGQLGKPKPILPLTTNEALNQAKEKQEYQRKMLAEDVANTQKNINIIQEIIDRPTTKSSEKETLQNMLHEHRILLKNKKEKYDTFISNYAKSLSNKNTVQSQYKIGNKVEKGGRYWTVIGFDKDGEPLVE